MDTRLWGKFLLTINNYKTRVMTDSRNLATAVIKLPSKYEEVKLKSDIILLPGKQGVKGWMVQGTYE